MNRSDYLALQAASARVNLTAWMIAHPKQPVPAEIVRDSMEKDLDFFLARLIARLESEPSSPNPVNGVALAAAIEPDSINPTAP